ncbi:helix-turn-helix domain-containing protein [Peptococcus simiae]|uniref:helix-turn-helix domain-containing protein n=1 Tax=Peptococcus simiae TaxID=1643805 RepID=UPI00397F9784
MDYLYSTTTEHKKGAHLTFEHRVLIQTRLKDGWSPNKIAKEIGCAPNTVRNEIKRGAVALYKGRILHDFLEKADFITFVEEKFFGDGWSLDACFERALKTGKFTRDQVVCTKTL